MTQPAKLHSRTIHSLYFLLAFFFAVGFNWTNAAHGQSPKIDGDYFREHIRPILSDKCYTCHGPDEQTREGGFRFDVSESAFGEADSGEHPIVASSIDQSELVKRILADDDSQMPPENQQKQLTDQEKEHLRRWIAGGAPWQEHWAFESTVHHSPPDTKALRRELNLSESWATNSIDAFVLHKLTAQNLTPSPRTDKSTLIRRVSLDLTGLPPTPEEVDAFLQDDSSDAYEKVVNRLLTSPHYGEHFASAWLDAARFADTNGYQNDFSRTMWPWRDWVIKAFNDNMPFDQFTIEQLAGDMLPDATLQQKIASGFNRNNRSVTEGGSIEQEWHVENVIDRVETVSTAFLGLTMGCARCHDHKYDPISHKEFYEFYAYFNSSKDKGVYLEKRGNAGPVVHVPSPNHRSKIDEMEKTISELKISLSKLESVRTQDLKIWETEFANQSFSQPTDFPVGFFATLPSNANRPESVSELSRRDELKSKLVDSPFVINNSTFPALRLSGEKEGHVSLGANFDFDGEKPFSVSLWIKPQKYGAILSRMDAEKDYRGFDILLTEKGQVNVHLIHKWPTNAIKITTNHVVSKNQWSCITVSYDGSQKASGVSVFVDEELMAHKVNNDDLTGSTLTDHPFWIGHRSYTPFYAGAITDLRIFDRQLSTDEIADLFRKPIRELALLDRAERTQEQSDLLNAKFASRFSPVESEALKKLAQAEQEMAAFMMKVPTTMVMAELETPRETYLLKRGQYDQPDESEKLKPGIPAFLPQPKAEHTPNRLGLARWIVDADNPLTARVAVNRFWQNYFGVGLLETSENFGVQSPLPSHPKLLDWLAIEFIRSNWDVKSLQKRIVMSDTYCQSSTMTAESIKADPKNRWLARGPRFRLSSEAIRDNALAVSGLLTTTVGGPSMKPYQPEGLWKELAGGAGEKPYVQATDASLYRRSLYIYRKRTVPHPAMSTFDSGSREICQVARQRTNTPLQALALLNDVTYVEAARAMATKAMIERDTAESRIQFAFHQALSRKPIDQELTILLKAYRRYQKRFAAAGGAADKLIEFGELTTPNSIDHVDLAALTIVCSTILNLDETITKE